MIFARWPYYAQLMRLDKPIGILLLLWPTLWALWLAAEGWPAWPILWVFIAGVILMRSAGCVINDYADRRIDPLVSRTQNRPLAAGKVTPKEALWLFAILCFGAFLLVLTLNGLTILLSIVAAFLAATYPFMKRITPLPQVYLGAAFGFSIPMAFAAVTATVPPEAWWLLLATLCWTVAYDTEYAMVDRVDDLKIGVKSTAILFGRYDRLWIAVFQLLAWGLWWWIGTQLQLTEWYRLGLLGALLLFVYQQWLIRERDEKACFQAFLNNQWVGMIVFVGLFLQLYWH
jgi:4-hydroxybenzoate polyprenyltransferase